MQVDALGADDPKWPEALGRLPHDIYHLPEYARLEGQRLGARAEAICIRDGDREIFVPYLVRSCREFAPPDVAPTTTDVVSPYGYPGMLVSDAGRTTEFVRAAFDRWRDAMAERGVISGFFRMNPILDGNLPELAPEGTFVDGGETVAFDLARSEVELRRGMREAHRVTVRKARDAGYVVREARLGDSLDMVVAVYRQTMDRVRAADAYYFDRDYFAGLARLPTLLWNAELAGEVGAMCIFTECGGIVQAHLGGTSDRHITHSPFHLVLFEAALLAKKRGNRWLHLGGGLGGKKDRLLAFKAGFSRERFRFRTYRMIADQANYRRLVEHRSVQNAAPAPDDFFPAYRTSTTSG